MENAKRKLKKRATFYNIVRLHKYHLLGKDKQGNNLWVEEPVYDRDMGWLFGTIVKFSNKRNPPLSARISFSDIEGLMFDGHGIHNADLSSSHNLTNIVFTPKESYQFGELFERFSALYKTRQMLSDENQKYCGVEFGRDVTNGVRDKIDNVLMPPIVEKIKQLLE